MEFFNPKEDVLDLQLTQYGKRLLKSGKFKPVRYAFFDDDILYDKKYASGSHDQGQNDNPYELQNDSEPRIQEETPRTKAQYNFSGIESNIGTMDDQGIEQPSIQLNAERDYCLGVPMGNSDLNSDYAPSWKVSYLYGELSGSTPFITGSNHGMLRIPQLESTIEYDAYVTDYNSVGELRENFIPDELQPIVELAEPDISWRDGGSGDIVSNVNFSRNTAPDMSLMQVVPDFVLLEVAENNVQFLNENFEIEVFMLENGTDNRGEAIQTERQLFFFDENSDEEVKEYHVEYYLNIDTDENIISDYFCVSDLVEQQRENILTDRRVVVDCSIEQNTPRNLYLSDISDLEDPCDDTD